MKTFLTKSFIVALGCVISVFGLMLAVCAGFGASTFTTMLDGVAHTLSITMGQASWIVNAAIFLFCLIYDRRQVNVGTVIVLIGGLGEFSSLTCGGVLLCYSIGSALAVMLMVRVNVMEILRDKE